MLQQLLAGLLITALGLCSHVPAPLPVQAEVKVRSEALRCIKLRRGGSCLQRNTGMRVTEVSLSDGAELSSAGTLPVVDVVQDVCENDDGTTDPETFSETKVSFKIKNDTNEFLEVKSFFYKVRNADGAGATFVSRKIRPVSERYIDPSAEALISFLFLDISGGLKYFVNSSYPIPVDAGFHDLTFFILAKSSTGRMYVLPAKVTVSFDNYDRCEE